MKQGLEQVSAVVQTNAATAEENSATSEEMSAQAATLQAEVGNFKLADEDTPAKAALHSFAQESTPMGAAQPEAGSDFGKY